MVGQLEKVLMPSRTSWSSNTFTALNLTPIWDRICTVTAEKSHCGKAGVPFMYSSTSLFFTSSAIRA